MKKFLFILCLCVMFIPFDMAGAQEPVPAIADTTIPISGQIRDAINAWLATSAPIPMPNWVITYVGQEDPETGETFVSLVALDLANPATTKWHITDDNIVKWMGSVTVHDVYGVEVFSDGGYNDDPISQSGGGVMFRPILAKPMLDGGGSNVRFPWEGGASMMYGTRGIHAAGGGAEYAIGFSAVDFLGGDDLGSGVASNKVYAVAEGQVDYVCQDATTTLIRTENTETDDYYIYAHLLDNANLTENYTFYQGDYIGALKYGTFDDTCGWAEQTAKHYHLHFGFKPSNGSFQMEGCILSMSSQKWTCGSTIVSTGQFLRQSISSPVTGDDASAFSNQISFWDYMLNGGATMWEQFVLNNLPEHTANQFLYALYNGVAVAVRIARVMVYSNINLGNLVAVVVFGLGIKAIFAIAEFIVFLFKAWKSLVPVLGA